MPDPAHPRTAGAILAGGLARRMGGGDKSLRAIGGRTVLARIVDRLTPQVTRLVINANDDPSRFDAYRLPVVADSLPDHPGPLAGVLAALDWAAADPAVLWLLSVPGDAPFMPRDLLRRLHAARAEHGTRFACAASGGRTHPVIGLWPVAIRDELRHAVGTEGVRKIDLFTARGGCATAEWPTAPVDPFFNVNRPDDLAEAEHLVALHPAL